jgi:methionyl-tRNA formyltransferase
MHDEMLKKPPSNGGFPYSPGIALGDRSRRPGRKPAKSDITIRSLRQRLAEMDVPSDTDLVYASCTEPGHDVLEALFDAGVPIREIVTITPAMAEKHGVVKYAEFDAIAEAHDVPVYHPETYSMTEADHDHFATRDADLLIVNGWQRLIPEEVLETFTHGALGNHGSAMGLPKGRGRSPLNWSLIQGYDRFLLSVIRLAPGADDGDVVTTRKFDVNEYDTIESLYYKVTVCLKEMFTECLGPVARGEWEFTEQAGEPTFYPKRTPDDGDIHWGDSTRDVYNLVRAVTDPYPGAFTFHEGNRIDVWEVRPFSTDIGMEADAGTIVDAFWTGEFVVATADGSVLVTDWEARDEWAPEAGMRLDLAGDHDRVDAYEHRHNLTTSDHD